MSFFLQALPEATEAVVNPDSIKTAVVDFAQEAVKNPNDVLHQLGQSAIQFGLKVLAALVIYLIGSWIIRRVKKLLKKIFTKRKTDKALAGFVSSLTTVVLTILLIVITVGTLGVNTSSLAAVLAAGGVAIGMAMSGALQNFAGGIMLLAFKPFKIGDFIEAQGYMGTVTDLTIVSTHLTTPDNKAVIIPNGPLSSGNINNFSKHPVRRIDWTVAIAPGTDLEACKAKLVEILRSDARVLDSRTEEAGDPFVAVSEFSESKVVLTVRGWGKAEDYWGLFFDMNDRFYKELPAAGFGFAYPKMDVRVLQ